MSNIIKINVPEFCAWLVMITEWLVYFLPVVLLILVLTLAGVGIWSAVERYRDRTGGNADG